MLILWCPCPRSRRVPGSGLRLWCDCRANKTTCHVLHRNHSVWGHYKTTKRLNALHICTLILHIYLLGDDSQICLLGGCLLSTYVPLDPSFNVNTPCCSGQTFHVRKPLSVHLRKASFSYRVFNVVSVNIVLIANGLQDFQNTLQCQIGGFVIFACWQLTTIESMDELQEPAIKEYSLKHSLDCTYAAV